MGTAPKTVLVVDNDLDVRAAFLRVGKQLDLEVAFASSASQALKYVSERMFDLLAISPSLAYGLAVIRFIEAIDERVAIIVVSATKEPRAIAAAFDAGAEYILYVPFDAADVRTAIARTIGPPRLRLVN